MRISPLRFQKPSRSTELKMVLNVNTEEGARQFKKADYGTVFVAERERGVNMSRHVIDRFAVQSLSHD